MVSRTYGSGGGYIKMGPVQNAKDDPWQMGNAKVKWNVGNQDKMSQGDMPWSKTAFSSDNPSLNHTGGPHTGLQEGSHVVGVSPGSGQDTIILGSFVKGGSGANDGKPSAASDLPYAALSQSNGGVNQPAFGDRNGVATQESLTKYAEESGAGGKPASFSNIDDSIGTWPNLLESID